MGAIVNPISVERGLRAEFVKAYDNAEDPNDVKPLIMETGSTGPNEKYGWLGSSPSLSEWVDKRKLQGLLDNDYTVPNKNYEATLQVDRNDLEDDRLGNIKIRINDLAVKAKLHMRKLFFDRLINGASDLCYDGQAFFSASHDEGDSGTQTNLIASGSGITVAHLKTDFNAAVAQMRNFLDDRGEIFDDAPGDFYVVCSPALEHLFKELFNATIISTTTNTLVGAAKIIGSGRLTSTDVNDWYLMSGSGALKPILHQKRRNIEFTALEAKSDSGFMSRFYKYGVDERVGSGYGLWQKAIKVINA